MVIMFKLVLRSIFIHVIVIHDQHHTCTYSKLKYYNVHVQFCVFTQTCIEKIEFKSTTIKLVDFYFCCV